MTAWYEPDSFLTRAFGPHLSTILITLLITLTLPLLVHAYLYRTRAPASLPTILLLGPSNAGKTALLTHLETGSTRKTHTSQTPLQVSLVLPEDTTAGSNQYRSVNDPSVLQNRKFQVLDTPGHGKLRHYALSSLASPSQLKGIIFLVDSADLSSGSSGLAETAEYLHDVLLPLQKVYTSSKTSKVGRETPVLIAANKADLFTALPPSLVQRTLEAEITKVRETKSKGLKDSGVGMGEADGEGEGDEEREWLGEFGVKDFKFGMMEEVNVRVEVRGGNVVAPEGKRVDVSGWWEWIGAQL